MRNVMLAALLLLAACATRQDMVEVTAVAAEAGLEIGLDLAMEALVEGL